MALYYPATSWSKASEMCKIPKTETLSGVTVYVIEVNIAPHKWTVNRRYRDFAALNHKLSAENVDTNLLPPKKYFGTQVESFIAKRQSDLELYLQTLFHQFARLPPVFAKFLDFHLFEINTIITNLTEKVYKEGDLVASTGTIFEMSPLELHAITERLKLALPTCSTGQSKHDLGHLLSFIWELKHLKITGNESSIGTSNIIPNKLKFDLKPFKSLMTLQVENCDLENELETTDPLNKCLTTLTIHNSMKDLSAVTLSGIIHWSPNDMVNKLPPWSFLTTLDLRHNSLTSIHPSVELLSSLERLNLSFNLIKEIENLEKLPHLTELDLSFNKLLSLESLHLRLGNVRSLILNGNSISSLHGFTRLYSLVNLRLDGNLVASLEEIVHISKLPCLECLNLADNPISSTVDFRSNVLLLFGARAPEIFLDGVEASEKEIDTVAVLQALQIAKQEKRITNCDDSVCSTEKMMAKLQHSFSEFRGYQGDRHSNPGRKLRQEVAMLRKIGGSDWLRLLNEMQNQQAKAENAEHESKSPDVCTTTESLTQTNAAKMSFLCDTSSIFSTPTVMFPDWVLSLGASQQCVKENLERYMTNDIGDEISPSSNFTDFMWAICVVHQRNAKSHFPVCILLLMDQIIVLKCDSTFSMSNMSLHLPRMSHYKTIFPENVLSFIIGTCKSYFVLETDISANVYKLVFLMPNSTVASNYISTLTELYNFVPLVKSNPFTGGNLEFEEHQLNYDFADSTLQKQILFCERVLVLEMMYNCPHISASSLHYLLVTPSHIILIQENINLSKFYSFKCKRSMEYNACLVVSIQTNVKKIHLGNGFEMTDVNETELQSICDNPDKSLCDYFCRQCQKPWLFLEFSSGVVLNVEFLCLQDQNLFLNAFSSSRSANCPR